MADKHDLKSQIKAVLDKSESELPDSVQAKLAEARSQALLAKEKSNQTWTREWVAMAACVALVVPIWFGMKSTTPERLIPASGLDLMVSFAELDDEEWELVDDLEFALWLSEQSDLAEQAKPS